MEKIVDLSKEITEKFYDSFNDFTTFQQIDFGGRGSTKSTKNTRKIVFKLIEDIETNVLVIRRYSNSHEKSTVAEFIKAFSFFGLIKGLNYNVKYYPFLEIELQHKEGDINKILFSGAEDVESLKGLTLENGKQFTILYIVEFNQLRSLDDLANIISTVSRGKKEYFISILECNAPELGHWVYDYFEENKLNEDFVKIHTTYEDLTENQQQEWLGKFFLKEANNIKKYYFDLYQKIYLGIATPKIGACYTNFGVHNLLDFEREKINLLDFSFSIGVDYGEADATVFTVVGFNNNFSKCYVFEEIYHKNSNNRKKNIDDYASDLSFLIDRYTFSNKILNVFVDSANLTFFNYFQKIHIKYNKNVFLEKVDKKKYDPNSKGAIQERIDVVNLLLNSNILIINKFCKELIKALYNAQYNKKGERLDNGTTNIDSLDSLEYALRSNFKFLVNSVYKK